MVDLSSDRFEFMNTLFELSRASLWTQLVDRHDQRPLAGIRSYVDLYHHLEKSPVRLANSAE